MHEGDAAKKGSVRVESGTDCAGGNGIVWCVRLDGQERKENEKRQEKTNETRTERHVAQLQLNRLKEIIKLPNSRI